MTVLGWRSVIRDAAWMTRARARAYRDIMLLAPLLSIGLWIVLSHDGVDPLGKPIGTDFVSFWTASQVALRGSFADAYNIDLHWGAQRALFPDADPGYEAFFYPPVFLLLCLNLALLPYFWSLACWLGVTGFACWRALRALAPAIATPLTFLAFPAVYLNAMFGQNGYLSTALYAGAVVMLDRRPVLAGLCLGALVYKPHLLVLVPVALIAARRWATLAITAITAIGLCLLSALCLGLDVWRGFLANTPLARATLEQELVGAAKMQSVFAAAQLYGASPGVAYAAQILSAIAVTAVLGRLAWTGQSGIALGVALLTATLLTTPFLLGYDLMLLAIPLLWVLGQAIARGFLPWEKTVLMAGFMLPMISSTVARYLMVPLAPLVIASLFAVVARRASRDP